MLVLAPALFTGMSAVVSHFPMLTNHVPDDDDIFRGGCYVPNEEPFSGLPALFLVPLGSVLPCLASVLMVAGQTRHKHTHAMVNLGAPISAVYAAWFGALATLAALGAFVATVTGYTAGLQLFTQASFLCIYMVCLGGAVANVAIGVLCGSLVTRPLNT